MNGRADAIGLSVPGIRNLQPYQPGKPVEDLERELGIRDAVKVASNENPRGPSAAVRMAIQDASLGLNRYPDGGAIRLKETIATKLGVEQSQITLGNGSNDVLELLVRAFVQPDQRVVISEHAFAVYYLAATAAGAEVLQVPANNWAHDLDSMLDAINDRTRLTFVANPNNPTGTWVTRERLQAFLDRVPEHVIVVVDEAYFEYVEHETYPNAIELLTRYPNLVVTRTFSKIYGLAGLRVGYGVSSEIICDLLNRIRQPFNVNTLAQVAAITAIGDQAYVEESKALNREQLTFLEQGLSSLGLATIPSAGNFICVDCGQDAAPIYRSLLTQGVITRPVANYGMPHHLRFTVGLPSENQRALDALKNALQPA